MKPLRDTGVYCLGLTPFQYTVRLLAGHPMVCALLMPKNLGSERITGPQAYITHQGVIGISEGLTVYQQEDLMFTGRYNT